MVDIVDINSVLNTNKPVTQKVFADIIGVSQQLVSDLCSRGVLQHGQTLGEWILKYCAHLREQAAGRAAEGGLDLATERAGLAREQRIRIEMQNAITRREFGPIDALENGLADGLSKIAAQLDAIPGKLKRRSNNLTSDDLNTVSLVIAEARNLLAAMDIDWFGDKTEEQEQDGSLEATSESSD